MSTRYRLQEAFKLLGPESTLKLAKSHVVIVGCGATGSHAADTLARMGVGTITVADPDVVEGENLHRQLYTEADCYHFKAEVLANHIRAINSDVTVHCIVDRITPDNIALHFEKIDPVDLILDCTDNMPTRWLINDYAVQYRIPWVYCGVGKSEGMVMPIIPGQSACFRCTGWAPQDPQEKLSGGIFPPTVAIMANMQATIAVKILTGNIDGYTLQLRRFNVWTMEWMSFNVQRSDNCEVCGKSDV